MVIVLMVNGLIAMFCWVVTLQLLRCRARIVTATVFFEQATTLCEQLRWPPLILAEQELQVLQLRQLYQGSLGQLERWRQIIQLILWLKSF